jgi:alkylation response protein AidB-like acyl-CoA dehydrogenase
VDFELTADQEALQQGVRSLCQGRFGLERVRQGFDRAMWDELAEAGAFSLREIDLGLADAAVVFEELGRAVVPGPLIGSALAADGTVAAVAERGRLVAHLDAVDAVFLLDDAGVLKVAPADVRATHVEHPLDPLTPMWRMDGGPDGERIGGPDEAARWRTEGTLLTAAFQLGLAGAVIDLAVDYARERKQFDRPIGSFQAVKHILADMLVRAEVARAAVYAAAVTLDTPEVGDGPRALAGAKLLAGEAAIANGKACIQVHGGVGFTWEVPAHLYLKRAWILDTTFGSSDDHALAVAARL